MQGGVESIYSIYWILELTLSFLKQGGETLRYFILIIKNFRNFLKLCIHMYKIHRYEGMIEIELIEGAFFNNMFLFPNVCKM